MSGGCSRELIYDFMNGNHNLRPTCGCGVEDGKNQYFNIHVPIALSALHWICHRLSTSYVGYTSGGEGQKMINQYFNVYALRRVHCAGYAAGFLFCIQ